MSIGQFIILVFMFRVIAYVFGYAIDEKRVDKNEIRNKVKNSKRNV